MRMVALIERACSQGDRVVFAGARLDEALADRVRNAGATVHQTELEPGSSADVKWVSGLAATPAADWVVLDGDGFGAAFQEGLRASGLRVLLLDDYGGRGPYAADVVLNQNVFATSEMYQSRRAGTRLLLGPAYALLRQEFASARRAETMPAEADRLLVTLGGADPYNVTDRVLDGLALVSGADLRIRVVVGPSNPHRLRLASHATIDPRVVILPPVDRIVHLMAWADMAITGGGITVYELCCMGVPTLVVPIVSSQREFASALDRDGICVDLGKHESLDPASLADAIGGLRLDAARRTAMSRRALERVDGRGSERVLDALNAPASG
jgi:UDP-2,4-diacetamido-2,4,6-trideoxy-beta-L-altropyranose hydrolase